MSNVLAATVTGALGQSMNLAVNATMSQGMNPTMNPARAKTVPQAQPNAMANTQADTRAAIPGRLLDLIQYFFTPEDSSRPMPLRRSRADKAAKALFWVAASIAMGILLAQLG